LLTYRPITGLAMTAVLLGAWAWAPEAVAQDRSLGPGAPALATTRYEAGIARYRAGDYAGAASEFRIALSAMPGSAILAYNLGKAEERAQQWEAALSAYTRYLELAPLAEDRAEVQTVVQSIQSTLDRVKPFTDIETEPPGASLLVDGAEIGMTPVKVRLPIGAHDVVASAPGYAAARQRIELAPEGPRKFRLTLEPTPASATSASTLAPPAPSPATEPDTRRILAWSAVGLGAVALGFGVHQTITAADAANQGADPGAGDAARQARLREDLDAARLGMGLGFGLGAAFLGAGLALFLWPESPTGPGAAALSFDGFTFGGRF
jgi:tetratricopeptide (TPR) repeat protein